MTLLEDERAQRKHQKTKRIGITLGANRAWEHSRERAS
jgi:hypothetical protein